MPRPDIEGIRKKWARTYIASSMTIEELAPIFIRLLSDARDLLAYIEELEAVNRNLGEAQEEAAAGWSKAHATGYAN